MSRTNKLKGKRLKKVRTNEKVKFDLEEAFAKFIIAREAEGRSSRTIERDRTNFKTFLEYLNKKNIQRDIRLVTKEVIRDYVVWMLHEKVRFEGHKYKSDDEKTVGLSPTTVNTRLKTLKVFFRFLKDEELIEQNPTEDVKNVRENETDIRILTPDEIRRLLEVPDRRSYAEFRDFVTLELRLHEQQSVSNLLRHRFRNGEEGSWGLLILDCSCKVEKNTNIVCC
jgi:integrase/recombinase XerD